MNGKKKIIIGAIIVIALLVCVGSGYFLYQKNVVQKEIDKKINEISEDEKKFSETKKRENKLEILKATFGKMEKYNASKGKKSKVSNKYKDVVSDMQAVFTEEYNTTIKDNTIEDFDKSENIETLSKSQEVLNTLLETVKSEKDYTFSSDSAYEECVKKISDLTEGYSNRITTVEEQKKAEEEAEAKKKAEEEAQRQAEAKAKTHYENEYFSVDVPESWIDCWSVTEENSSSDGNTYSFAYDGGSTYSGGATIYVVDATYGLPQNGRVIEMGCELVGYTSNNFAVFSVEAGAGFFSAGATLKLK